MFTNREIAILIWTIVIIIAALSVKSVRSELPSLIKSFFKLWNIFLIFLIYITLLILVLYAVGIWNPTLLKDTVYWLFIALMIIFKTVDANSEVFKDILLDNIKTTVFIEFLVNTYTFALWIEILLVPFLTFIEILDYFSSSKEEFKTAQRLFQFIKLAAALTILWNAIDKAIKDLNNFGKIETLYVFLLPVLLTVCFLPFAYCFAVYTSYSAAFTCLKMGLKKDPSLIKFAKWSILKHCGLRLNRIRDLGQKNFQFMRIQSKEDVLIIIKEKNS